MWELLVEELSMEVPLLFDKQDLPDSLVLVMNVLDDDIVVSHLTSHRFLHD
jgi:hypothetical protein